MSRWAPIAIGCAGVLAAAAALMAWDSCDCTKLPWEGEFARVAAGLAFVGVGLIAWTKQRNQRIGAIMSAVGLTWFVGDLGWIYQPLPYTVGTFGGGLFQPVLAHLTLAFPSGWLRYRSRKAVVASAYGLWLLATVGTQVFWDPADDCNGCSRNLLLLDHDPALHALAENISVGLVIGMSALVIGLVVHRWLAASTLGRRALSPVLWAAAPLSGAVIAYSLVGKSAMPPLAPLALTALPLAFLIGLLRAGLSRAALGSLVIELGESPPPQRLRDALARTLHDDTLQVVYWRREQPSFVDASGAPLKLPADGSGRAATVLEHEGEPIAALIHDVSLKDDPELIEAAAAAARLAIENERLRAEILAQLDEVRASRARVVEAADLERRRIERNLHDGSQQRLVTVSLALGMIGARLGPHIDAELRSSLTDATEGLKIALAELRELARGIHPAILTEAGLGPALESLAERSPVPATLTSAVRDRLPDSVEAAAYFVVAEALTNSARYAGATLATISAEYVDGCLVVHIVDDGVGGADPRRGSGLRGLADRVGALGGHLRVVSPPGGGTQVVATFPTRPPWPVVG